MSKFNKPKYHQYFANLKYCPLSSNGSGKLENNHFYWEFDIKPSDFSKVYKVLLIWDFSKVSPTVYILNEDIRQVAKEKTIPHLYSQEKIRLCLYYPLSNEFSSYMSLCETIIPWTLLWLSYYEEWLYSGEWKGGGIHPETIQTDKKSSPLKKIAVNRRLKKEKAKKSNIDKIYEKRRKVYLKNKI